MINLNKTSINVYHAQENNRNNVSVNTSLAQPNNEY